MLYACICFFILAVVFPASLLASDSTVVITEFLAGAADPQGLVDEDGDAEDWIELHNSGNAAVNLLGWSVTDDPDDPNLWAFPPVILQPDQRLVIFASGKDRRAGISLHTNFKLSTGGEYLALFNPEQVATTEFRGGYPEQRNDYSYGWDGVEWRYYRVQTPGAPNGESTILGLVPKPQVTVKRGFFAAPFELSITNQLPGTTIRYTLDGSAPTETSGGIFTGPLNVSKTTILRAAAFRAGYLPSEIITHTYLFLDQVLRQPNNPPGFPLGQTVMAGYPSDYEMDPEVVNDPAYARDMKAALQAFPSVSIVMKVSDMFGGANGIYTHPLNRGPQWERACSMEFIPLDGKDFQADAGIQIQGNAAREPQKQPKHPFRVVFKGDYGAKVLDERVFPDSPVKKFDTLILRADFNYSWLHWNPTQRIRAQRTRDAWMKDSMRAMGGLASHNRFVHLYINGLYWGIYDISERPDGSFGAAYLGGSKEQYDVVNEGALVDGAFESYNTLTSFSNFSDIARYNAAKEYLDIPQFIDYMLLHFFVGHEDWGLNKNWYTIRPKDGSRGFLYIPWDGEMILGDTTANRVSNTDVPSGLHTRLLASAEYKLEFADRVQRHMFNDGALTPARNVLRWQNRARDIELPIIAESARWGDYRRDVHQYQSGPYELYTRDNQWRAEQTRLINTYFPGRTATVLSQLRAAGLYPSVVAPSFNQHGGRISTAFELRISAPSGIIYYTTNGIDPRIYGSEAVSLAAKVYDGPVRLAGNTHVKARVRLGSSWSALTDATFSSRVFRTPLRITEIMYNPDPPCDACEFIELENIGDLPFDATGYSFQGVDFIFSPGSVLQPGQRIVLGSGANPATFAARQANVSVFGWFNGQLSNAGERLSLISPAGKTVISIDYADRSAFPRRADGQGASLEINDAFGDPDSPMNWHASGAINGSPGVKNSVASVPVVRFNEILTEPDWVELQNTSATPVSLAGWVLRELGNTNQLVFPDGAELPAGGYLVVPCGKSLEGLHAPFGLDSEAQTLVLDRADGLQVDVMVTGPQARGFSCGYVDGRLGLTMPTPGAPNVLARAGPQKALVINEWLASSGPGEADWIEIHNLSEQDPVSLTGLFIGVTEPPFEITAPVFVAPGGYVRLFADEQPGPNHLDFKLPGEGASLRLYDADETLVDSIDYGPQASGISQGVFPEGTHNIVTFDAFATPGRANSLSFPLALTLGAGTISIEWPSIPSASYRVERSDDLVTWTKLIEQTATQTTSSAVDPLTEARRYYRVIALRAAQ